MCGKADATRSALRDSRLLADVEPHGNAVLDGCISLVAREVVVTEGFLNGI